MKTKAVTGIVLTILLLVVSFALTLPVHSFDGQPVGEGRRSEPLGLVILAPEEEVDVIYGIAPNVDGSISAGEYTDANSATFATLGGTCTVYFKHDGNTLLYVAFDVPNVDAGSAVQIFVDTEYDRANAPQTDDYRFTIAIWGQMSENQGTGTDWTSWYPPEGWIGACQVFASTWNAEFAIPYAKLGITAGVAKTIGISFWNAWTSTGDHRWPSGADWMVPSTWGSAYSSDNWSGVDWWPMFHHDLSLTGYSTSTGPDTSDTIWIYTTGDLVVSSPAVVDGKVYVGSTDHKIYCLDAETGAHIWNYTTDGGIVWASPAVAYGKVYVGAWLTFYCLDASTGAHIWDFPIQGGGVSSSAVAYGKVYVGGANALHCLNAVTGAHIWSYTQDVSCVSPAVVDGKVYAVSTDHKIYCVNAETGAHIWDYTTGDAVWFSSPAVAGGKVYAGSNDHKIYCLDAETGAHIWDYTTGDSVQSSPAVAYGKVYVGSYDRKIYCLDALTGVHIWNYTTSPWATSESSPAVADGKVYVGSGDAKVYCLDAETGAHIWSYATGNIVQSSPAVADGKVYIGSNDGKVYAFGPAHTLTITTTTGGTTSPPPGTHKYSKGIPVSVTAIPDANYDFDHWELDGVDVGSANPYSVLMDSDHTLHAVFVCTLTITATAGGITDPTPGTHTYTCDSSVEVTAIPNNGYVFDHWELDGSWNSSNPISVTMDSDHTLHAVFIPAYDVTIQAHCHTEDTSVSVSVTMDGLPTGYNTTHTFTVSTGTHTFTVPNKDRQDHPFKQWSTGETSTTITVSSAGTYTAYYQAKYTLTITRTTGGTTDPSLGTHIYWDGTVVSVTAIPDTDYDFDHWELDGSWNDSNPITVTMDSDHDLYAVFIPVYDVTIKAFCSIEGAYVSVSIDMDGLPPPETTPHTFTGLTGTHTFTVPDADPNDHLFCCWSTGETSTTITVTSSGTYTAYYGTPPPVGGIWVAVDKLGLLAPYIGLASTIIVATVATATYVKRVKRRKEKQ